MPDEPITPDDAQMLVEILDEYLKTSFGGRECPVCSEYVATDPHLEGCAWQYWRQRAQALWEKSKEEYW